MKTDSYKTFHYPSDYDEQECEKFITEWLGFAIFIAVDTLKYSKRYVGLDLARTAALEGIFRTYFIAKDGYSQGETKSLIRMMVKRCFWSFCVIFGYLPSSGQIFFPKEFVNYDVFFRDRSNKKHFFDDLDINIINEFVESFSERERDIHTLYLGGYDFAEISRKIGYANKSSPLKMHKRMIERLKIKINRTRKI